MGVVWIVPSGLVEVSRESWLLVHGFYSILIVGLSCALGLLGVGDTDTTTTTMTGFWYTSTEIQLVIIYSNVIDLNYNPRGAHKKAKTSQYHLLLTIS